MNLQILDFIVSTIGILMLAGFWHVFWRPLAVDHLRQDFFDLRDDLFDLVVEEKTSLRFDSKAYRYARRNLNMLIRYSHSISFFAGLLLDICIPEGRLDYIRGLEERGKTMTEAENCILGILDKCGKMALFRFLICTSPILWVASFLVCTYLAVLGPLKVLRHGFKVLNGGVCAMKQTLKELLFVPAIERVAFQIVTEMLSKQSGDFYFNRRSDFARQR